MTSRVCMCLHVCICIYACAQLCMGWCVPERARVCVVPVTLCRIAKTKFIRKHVQEDEEKIYSRLAGQKNTVSTEQVNMLKVEPSKVQAHVVDYNCNCCVL